MHASSVFHATLTILICFTAISAEETDSGSVTRGSSTEQIGQDVKLSISDAGALVKNPGQWDTRSWITAALATGAIGGAFALDPAIRRFAQSKKSGTVDNFILPWQYWGNGFVAGGAAGALYFSGLFFSNDWLRETGRSAITAMALTGAP